jgi:hypothetical protein
MPKPRQAIAAKKRAREPETKPLVRITDAIADEILKRLEDGESLRSICSSDPQRLPGATAIHELVARDSAFAERYARARSAGIDRLAEQTLAIADNLDEDPRSRAVRIDARKWFASKMRPDKYGDASKLTVDGTGPGGSIVIAAAKLEALSDDELQVAFQLQKKIAGKE